MTYDFEIYRIANSLLRKHGSLALLIAAEGADAQKESRRAEGVTWSRSWCGPPC